MISNETKIAVEGVAKELFERLGAGARVHSVIPEDSSLAVDVTMADAQMFIGDRGRTLLELQHLLQAMARKRTGERFFVSLDINDYKKRKEEYLQSLASDTANEVSVLRQPKELPPMPSSERRVIHLVVQERDDVESESVGEGTERRIIVRPKRNPLA